MRSRGRQSRAASPCCPPARLCWTRSPTFGRCGTRQCLRALSMPAMQAAPRLQFRACLQCSLVCLSRAAGGGVFLSQNMQPPPHVQLQRIQCSIAGGAAAACRRLPSVLWLARLLQALLLADEMKLDEVLAVMCVQGALQEVRGFGRSSGGGIWCGIGSACRHGDRVVALARSMTQQAGRQQDPSIHQQWLRVSLPNHLFCCHCTDGRGVCGCGRRHLL